MKTGDFGLQILVVYPELYRNNTLPHQSINLKTS